MELLYKPSATEHLLSFELHFPGVPLFHSIPSIGFDSGLLILLSSQRVCIFVESEQQSNGSDKASPRLSITWQILPRDSPALLIFNSRAEILEAKNIKI